MEKISTVIEFSIPLIAVGSKLLPRQQLRYSDYLEISNHWRNTVFEKMGISALWMNDNHFSPVIRNEIFTTMQKIKVDDNIHIHLKLKRLKNNFSEFSIQHDFIIENGPLCARIVADAVWINTKLDEIAIPPQIGIDCINSFPKTPDFKQVE